MKLKKLALLTGSVFAFCAANEAFAADVAPAPAPSLNNTIGIEFSPEWKTKDSSWADDVVKLSLSHTFDNSVVLGVAGIYTARATSDFEAAEASLGYKFKTGAFTLTPAIFIGDRFGQLPSIATDKTLAEAYYGFTFAADVKLTDHLTWNALNARYRNAFNVTWFTPKISTGVTYKFNSANAIYTNVGYAWKDVGDGKGLLGDVFSVAVGYKYSF